MTFHFDVSLEFKEDDGKGNFTTVPKDKNVFKLRRDVEKKLCILVTQISNKELKIERLVCFDLLCLVPICLGAISRSANQLFKWKESAGSSVLQSSIFIQKEELD